MRVVEKILGHFKCPRREDPVFGPMLFMGDRLNYWEGMANFPPSGSEIEIFVHGSAEDSMERQHGFFEQVIREWPSLFEEIRPLLFRRWHERRANTGPTSSPDQFTVSSLTVPDGAIENAA